MDMSDKILFCQFKKISFRKMIITFLPALITSIKLKRVPLQNIQTSYGMSVESNPGTKSI